ncbi:FUSC family protein [Arthrobacter sp. UYCu511]|uniref:FUSC family protein n=1 Tax=Arthrobacter sp. UYCu511 TaxID=3156337 RepID=UPI00339A41A4
MLATSSVTATVKKSLRLDFSQSDPVVAGRNALGIAIPLVVGVAIGSIPIAVFGAVGAMFAAFADRPGSYRLRLSRMGMTALAAGIGGGLSVLASHSWLLSVLLIAVFAFVSGMLLSLGPVVAQIGIAGTAVAIVLNRFQLPASSALGIAALVIAAGLLQSLLAIAGWPVHRHAPERAALGAVYEALAKRTRSPHPQMMKPGAEAKLDAARATITGFGHGHGPSMQAYRGLVDEAERIRLEVIALAYCLERFERVDRTTQANAVHTLLAAAGTVLDAVAESLYKGKVFDSSVMEGVDEAVDVLQTIVGDHPDSPTGRFASLHARALAGQLRACARMTTPGAVEGRIVEEKVRIGGIRVAAQAPFDTLRANLNPSSAVFRHAVRLAVLVSATDGLSRLLPSADRGYWISLMVLLLLRPDFASTLLRTSARLAGTLIGLGIGTVATSLVGTENHYALIALVVLFVFGVRVSGLPNAFFMAIWTAAYLVALLDLSGIPAGDVAVPRLVDTVIAGALAVAATVVWPAWERSYLPARLAELLASYGRYLVAVSDPAAQKSEIDAARIAARLARTNAQTSLDRTQAEPVDGLSAQYVGEGLLVQSHLFIQAAMVIDAARLSVSAAKGPVEKLLAPLEPFVSDTATTLTACQDAVRDGTTPRGAVNMRDSYTRLAEILPPVSLESGVVQPAIMDATDRIANSVDTMVHILRGQGSPRTAKN